MHGAREQVEAVGLMSYAPNFPDLFRRVADYIDKILRGAKPADLPVEQPTKFDLVINTTIAKGIGPQCAADAARPRRRGGTSAASARQAAVARLASILSPRKYGAWRTSRSPSTRLRVVRRRFTSATIRS